MATKIRLQRKGRKKMPYYYIVVADSRSPRDGKYIERIGSYNPNTNPATIDLDNDRALDWVVKGAQPTDTVRAILSYKGVMMRKHLMRGIQKGAIDQEKADALYANWLEEKAGKIDQKIQRLKDQMNEDTRKSLALESEIAHKRAQEIMAKRSAAEAPTETENASEEGATTEETSTEENQ